jgi:hypothetical protein
MRKRTKEFMGYINQISNPFRISKSKLIDFLIDLKETGKVDGLIQLSDEDIMKLGKDELIIEFDNIRNRVHSNLQLLYTLFPDLDKKYLDIISYGRVKK